QSGQNSKRHRNLKSQMHIQDKKASPKSQKHKKRQTQDRPRKQRKNPSLRTNRPEVRSLKKNIKGGEHAVRV
ncbi:hypothetical protein, partial [Staphylococcus felis]|uniref:hypothetical protein n=1 Tax=Staphylococcus felis TaxID=46127 RepID=UPI000E367431